MPRRVSIEVSVAVYKTLVEIAHREKRTMGEILGDALLLYDKEFPAEAVSEEEPGEIFTLTRKRLTWRRLAAKYCAAPTPPKKTS